MTDVGLQVKERLEIELLQPDGEKRIAAIAVTTASPWELEYAAPDGSECFEADDLFDCLVMLRSRLELQGSQLLCNGSRIDVFPSPESRKMSGGRRAYVTYRGSQQTPADIVDIFDPAEESRVGTVDEQRRYHDKWTRSDS